MIIDILKEIMQGERRVSAIPETINKYIALGAEVLVEKNAGTASLYKDGDYMRRS